MNAHCFIDGGYLLALGKLLGKPLVNPLTLARNITYSEEVQYWRSAVPARNPKDLALEWPIGLARILFYDARPEQLVVVAAEEASLADDLRRAADRVWPLDPAKRDADYPVLRGDDNAVWCVDETGKLARVLER